MRPFLWFVLAALPIVFPHGAVAQTSAPWVLLQTEPVDLRSGQQTIQIAPDKDRVRAIGLTVTDGSLEVTRVVVTYGNGQQHFEDRKAKLAPGTPTAAIGERDEALVVATLAITFKPGSPKPLNLQVWGLQGKVSAALPPGVRSRGAPAPASAKGYAELGVFFGTTRKREADRIKNKGQLATFSGEEGKGLTLGQAMVTIPIEREIGSIPRPDFDFILFRLPLRSEDPRKDFTLAGVNVLDRKAFAARVNQQISKAKAFSRQALVFVHGYNVGFDDAIFRTAQIAHDIGFEGPVITFSWPSRGGALDYRHDVDTAKASRDGLLELLTFVAKETNVAGVHLIAHSMGNDPVLEVLSRQGDIKHASGSALDLKLKEVVLASPDISRNAFIQLAEKFQSLGIGGVTLYASSNDRALLASKKAASGLVRAGDVPLRDGPLIVGGIETIDVSDASTSFFAANHSTFADRQHLVEDMRMLFEASKHPPDKRFPIFRVQGTQPKQWWRYLKN